MAVGGKEYNARFDAYQEATVVYGKLTQSTSDICQPRYHYFCRDEEAKLPEELTLALCTHPVLITPEYKRTQDSFSDYGVLRVEYARGTDKTLGYLVPEDRRSKSVEELLSCWKRQTIDALTKADAVNADVVCFPEFGCPFGLNYGKQLRLDDPDDHQLVDIGNHRILAKDTFVCLGSTHRQYKHHEDGEVRYKNVAVTYPSGMDTPLTAKDVFEAKVENIRAENAGSLPNGFIHSWEEATKGQGKNSRIEYELKIGDVIQTKDTPAYSMRDQNDDDNDSEKIKSFKRNCSAFFDSVSQIGKTPIFSFKKSPARKLGEFIDPTGLFELDVFVTSKGVIAVLICYDAFDPSIFLSAVRMQIASESRKQGFFHQGIDVILVPSFNRSTKLVDTCQMLSKETNSIVAYVSADPDCETKQKLFYFGFTEETLTEFMGVIRGLDEGEDIDTAADVYEYKVHENDEHIHLYRLKSPLLAYGKRSGEISLKRKYRRELMQSAVRKKGDTRQLL